MTEFGDHEPNDSFDPTGKPDPLQLAIFYHRVRKYLADVNGEPFPAWEDASEDERELAVAIFAAMVAWLIRQGTL